MNLLPITRRQRRGVATAVAVAAVLLAVVAPEPAFAQRTDPPGHRDGNHCITDGGADLNELFDVSEQLINRYCLEATAGEHWRIFVPWIVNEPGGVYPEGYVPADDAPLVDFVAKLDEVHVVIDGGTRHERRYVFPGAEAVRTNVSFDEIEDGAPALPMASIVTPPLRPLPVGEHTREIIVVLDEMHCDGLDTVVEWNCFLEGATSFGAHPIFVEHAAE